MPRKSLIPKESHLLDDGTSHVSCCGTSRFKKFSIIIVVIIILAISLFLAFRYVSLRWPELVGQKRDQAWEQRVYLKEVEALSKKISRHLLLPTGELPQLRTIEDAKAASEAQSFFAGTENGDKVLIYVNARKAIIYSPSRDVVVNVGPVFVDEPNVDKSIDNSTSTDKK